MEHYFLVGVGGTCGALLRYFISKYVGERYRGEWPLATFLINLTGAVALGFFSGWIINKELLNFFLAVGVLGGYTTFSTYIYETVLLMEAGRFKYCCSYLTVSLVLGVLFYAAGFWIGGKIF